MGTPGATDYNQPRSSAISSAIRAAERDFRVPDLLSPDPLEPDLLDPDLPREEPGPLSRRLGGRALILSPSVASIDHDRRRVAASSCDWRPVARSPGVQRRRGVKQRPVLCL
jgi:hypothetical protein